MATITKSKIVPVIQMHGSSPDTLTLLEAASQTFVEGELVFIDTTGYVTEISGDTPGLIYGVAAQDAHNTTAGESVAIYLADPLVMFEGNLLTTSLADKVLAQTHLGHPMAIQRDTTNSLTFLNEATTAGANVRVWVHDVGRGSAIGDTNARVRFTFLPNWVQYLATS